MTRSELLRRITARADVFGGKPIIRNMRLSVESVLNLLSQGVTPEAILDDHPELEPEDIRACVAYAHAVIANDTLSDVSIMSHEISGGQVRWTSTDGVAARKRT